MGTGGEASARRREDVAVVSVVDHQNARWVVYALPAIEGIEDSRGVFANLGEQRPRTVRLCHIGVAAGGARLALVAAQRIGGDDDDGDVLQRRIGLDAAGRLVAVEKWELNVHKDHIGMM